VLDGKVHRELLADASRTALKLRRAEEKWLIALIYARGQLQARNKAARPARPKADLVTE